MEALSRLNLSGDIAGMDDELMNDIVESFIKTGYLEIIPWENRQIVRYHDEEKELYIYADNLRAVEAREGKGYVAAHLPVVNFGYGYDWQNWVRSTAIDESATYYYDMALKIKRLLERRLPTASLADKAHYQAMLYAINSILAD